MRPALPAMTATLLRFGAVGVVNTAVSYLGFMAAFALLPPFSGRAALAQIPAYAIGMTTSFLLNRMWTFAAAGNGAAPAGHQASRFIATQAACLALTAAGLTLTIDQLGLPVTPAWVAVSLCITLLNFAAQRLWVFPARPAARD
jgi:putative flippase GtrA